MNYIALLQILTENVKENLINKHTQAFNASVDCMTKNTDDILIIKTLSELKEKGNFYFADTKSKVRKEYVKMRYEYLFDTLINKIKNDDINKLRL